MVTKRGPNKVIKESTTELGQFLRGRRVELGHTVVVAAKALGITNSHLVQIELGTITIPDGRTLARFAGQYDCVLEELVALRDANLVKSEEAQTLADFIKARRRELNLSQAEVSRALKCSLGTLHSAQTGRSTLKKRSAAVLAQVLKCEEAVIDRLRSSVSQKAPKIARTHALGKVISDRRLELGFTLQDLGDELGLTREAMRLIEMGTCRVGKAERFQKLADKLQVEVATLQKLEEAGGAKKLGAKPWSKHATTTKNPLLKFLIEERVKHGYSLSEVTRRMGCQSNSRVGNLESGTLRLTRSEAEKYARAIGVELPQDLAVSATDVVESERSTPARLELPDDFAQTVYSRRTKLRATQRELAQSAGVTQETILALEKGRQIGRISTQRQVLLALCELERISALASTDSSASESLVTPLTLESLLSHVRDGWDLQLVKDGRRMRVKLGFDLS